MRSGGDDREAPKKFFVGYFHLNFEGLIMIKGLLILMLFFITTACAWETAEYARYAMSQPGISNAMASDDGLQFRIALQRSSTGDNTAIAKVISDLVWLYGMDNHTELLQIGLADNQNRITTMWEISALDLKAHFNNTTWLTQIIQNPSIFNDDTRNYDPYGNRYTPIEDGKGILGSLVVPWLYGNQGSLYQTRFK